MQTLSFLVYSHFKIVAHELSGMTFVTVVRGRRPRATVPDVIPETEGKQFIVPQTPMK
jgi:hypothetical protein